MGISIGGSKKRTTQIVNNQQINQALDNVDIGGALIAGNRGEINLVDAGAVQAGIGAATNAVNQALGFGAQIGEQAFTFGSRTLESLTNALDDANEARVSDNVANRRQLTEITEQVIQGTRSDAADSVNTIVLAGAGVLAVGLVAWMVTR